MVDEGWMDGWMAQCKANSIIPIEKKKFELFTEKCLWNFIERNHSIRFEDRAGGLMLSHPLSDDVSEALGCLNFIKELLVNSRRSFKSFSKITM